MATLPIDPKAYQLKGSVRPKHLSVKRGTEWETTAEQKLDRQGVPVWLVGVVWSSDDGWEGKDLHNGWVEIASAERPVVKQGAAGDVFSGFEITVYKAGGATLRARVVN